MRDKVKRRISQKRYRQSIKGKINTKKFKNSPAGIASRKRYVEGHRIQLLDKSGKLSVRKKFNLSVAETDALFILKNGLCWCCGNRETVKVNGIIRKLSLDHNHTTGIPRGILCHRCNTVLGFLEKYGEIEEKLKEYLLRCDSGEKLSCIIKEISKT